MFILNNFYFNFFITTLILPIAYHNVDYIAFLYPLFLFKLTKSLREASLLKRFFIGFIHSWMNGLLGFYWIYYVITDFGHVPAPYNYFLTILFGIIPCYNLILPFLAPRFCLALLMISEILPKFFPWYIGARIGEPFLQLASIVGAPGLTGVCIIFSSIFLSRLRSFGAFIYIIIIAILGYLLIPKVSEDATFKKIAVVQPNIGNFDKLQSESSFDAGKRVLRNFISLTPKGADLVVWPETSFPSFYPQSSLTPMFNNFITEELNTPIVFGAYGSENNKDFSRVFYVDKEANILATFDKYQLVPFGEYLPSFLSFARSYIPQIGELSAGPLPKAKTIDGINIHISICLDGIYPWSSQKSFSNVDTNNNYNLHLSLTNDSWYGPTIERIQHLQLLQLRAIELRTPIIRATNDGISGMILSDGKVYQPTKINEVSVPIYSVPLEHRSKTFFELYGKMIYAILVLLVVLFDLIRFLYVNRLEKNLNTSRT